MGKYSTKQAARAQKISTPGGDYALKWDDETQMSVNAHAALLSQFAKAGGFFDRLVETCPMRLTSNNAPEMRDLIATVMVSMVNGATRFTQLDIPGLELVEAGDEDCADGYEWHALVTDLDMDARDVLSLYRDRGEPLERVHEARLRRDAPRGRHVPPASPVVRSRSDAHVSQPVAVAVFDFAISDVIKPESASLQMQWGKARDDARNERIGMLWHRGGCV